MIYLDHRKGVGNHEDTEGVEDHLPREHRPDALLLGWKRPWAQGTARVPDRESGGSPEENRTARYGSESALDVRRDHRDAREVISRVCGPEDVSGQGRLLPSKTANPQTFYNKRGIEK